QEKLYAYLKQHLANYMVPSAIVVLETLPLLSNGKINKHALPEPKVYISTSRGYVAARNPIERRIAAIWESVLHVQAVGIHDNFFTIGGHSLLAMQVISRLCDEFQQDIPLQTLFDAPTSAELAEKLRSTMPVSQAARIARIQPVERKGSLPLSFSQERLWFIDQFTNGSPLYNEYMFIRIKGELQHEAVKDCFTQIVQRHETLRTNFIEQEGKPIQIIAEQQELDFSLIDLTHYAVDIKEKQAISKTQEVIGCSFDLRTDRLFQVVLLQLDVQEHFLLLNMHHIVSDGWSMSVLWRDFADLYTAHIQQEPCKLPPLPIQYADYAVWQRNCMQGDYLQQQLSYWERHLQGALPKLNLPIDHPRPAKQSFRGAQYYVTIPNRLYRELQILSQHEGVTLFMALLASWNVLLARYSGQKDILIGTLIAGRTRLEIENLAGYFVNSLVMRTNLSNSPTFKEVLRRVREVTLGAFMHQDVPIEKVLEKLQLERDVSQNTLFQVLFILQNATTPLQPITGLQTKVREIDNGTAKFDLLINLEELADGLRLGLEYSTDLFERSTITRMAEHWRTLLESIVKNSDQIIEEIPVWSEMIDLDDDEMDELFV
ncbi:MAG TPA: condensation domain-containing protein, partial [Ktedonobacteraceae bacterium]